MAFHSAYSRPTPGQFALIGEIMSHWSLTDFLLVTVVARLAATPDFLGLAILERATFSQRFDAMGRLLELHEKRYHRRVIGDEAYLAARAVFAKIKKMRDARNDAAHAILFRMSDESIYAFKPQGKQAGFTDEPPLENRILGNVRNADLRKLADELAEIVEMVEALLVLLPQVDEQGLVDRAKHRPKD